MQNISTVALSPPGILAGQRRLTRREMLLWIVLGLLANHTLHTIDLNSFNGFLQSLASQNLVYWFACFVIVRRLLDTDPDPLASKQDLYFVIVGAVGLLLSSFIGYRFGVGLLTSVTALYILWAYKSDKPLKIVGIVLLALSVHLIWAPMLFRIFTPEFLVADAAALNYFLTALRPDISLIGTTFYSANGHAVTLVGGCSSFQNVSIALLASVSVTMFVRPYWVRSDIFWILTISATMVVLNVIRLGALAWDYETYMYWHNGTGVPIIGLVQTSIVALMSVVGANYGKRDR